MAYPNPVQLEAHFNETIQQISIAQSERLQLQLIIEFLKKIEGFEQETESYLIILFQKLPDFSNPLLYAGLNPSELRETLQRIETCFSNVDNNEGITSAKEKVQGYKKALAQCYRWIGEEVHSDILEDALVLQEVKQKKDVLGEVLIPVVEQIQNKKIGRLRRLKIDVLGESETKCDLKATFGVIGSDSSSFLKDVEQAAQKLLTESRAGKNKYWKGAATFELSHAWHEGRSANLALAAAFYCEMLKAEEQAEYFRLNPAVCITGDIDSHGNVCSVDQETLRNKVEAAFFSWAHVLVVPMKQLTEALVQVEHLQEQFPNRYLPVVGVSHLREVFFDRRLTLHYKTGAIAYNLKKAWKSRFSVASIFVFVVLIGVIGRLLYGPVDRNPTSVEFAGTSMVVKNKLGATLKAFDVDTKFVEHHENDPSRPKYVFIDVDDDGMNELVYVNYIYKSSENDSLFCFSFLTDQFLWKKEISLDLDYSFRPDSPNQKWGTSFLKTHENGIEKKLFIRVNISHFFTNAIVNIDPKTGDLGDMFVNSGGINDYIFKDFNGDGEAELLILASSNAFWGATLIVLNLDNFEGHAPSTKDYKALDIPYADIVGMVLFPKTIIGRKYSNSKGTYGRDFSFNEKTKSVTAHIFGTSDGVTSASTGTNPNILYFLDKDLRVTGIGSGNGWDILAREYYEKGILSFEPGIEYLTAFKDSLLWWDGEQFVNEPTLVNDYGEIKNDSIKN